MREKDSKLVFLNFLTTILVIVIPLLDLGKINQYISKINFVDVNSYNNNFIIIGIILSNVISILVIFNIIKVIVIYCKLNIPKQNLYCLFIIAKLTISIVNVFILTFQMPSYIIFIREMLFGVVLCILIYTYLEKNIQQVSKNFKKMVFLVMIVLVILNLLNFMVLFK